MENIFAVLPTPTAESRPFWEACNRGELLLQKCDGCGHVFYYPRQMCPQCGKREPGWITSTGRGIVYSYSHIAVSFYGAQWESQIPYTVILVDLDEGPRMLSRLIGDDRERAKIGDRLEVNFVEVGKQKLPFFRIAAVK
ncbi:MAG: Zn-ribbon domain-containing OB-fold protein [Betaproteobacteria bacterium]|nr:Zn-ribbon domain-containing OB-fold protein [Betaproteobacteria bacterium]